MASMDNIYPIFDFIISYAKENGFSKKKLNEVELISEEIIVNIIKHGYLGKEGLMWISPSFENGVLKIGFKDAALAFDPCSAIQSKEKYSGFGLVIISTFSDRISYKREGNFNIFTFEKKL